VATIKQTLSAARQRLQSSSTSPSVDASVLLCHVLDCTASHLVAWPEKQLTPAQQSRFAELLDQRAQGRPVAYLTGDREFWSLSLEVSPAVLIPRPETETLVEFVLETFSGRETLDVADLGTGSGAIACALASEHAHWNVLATDASSSALEIARSNASRSGLRNIRFRQGDWFDALDDLKFDLIVSNPPYVASDDIHLEQGDLRYEPPEALAAGERGMDAISHLAREANRFLKPGGWLVVEHGYDQQNAVYDCFDQAGFKGIVQRSDLAGIPRMTAGWQPDTNT